MKNSKRVILIVLGVALFSGLALVAQARKGFDGERMLKMLTEKLELSEAQQAKVSSIFEANKPALEAIKKDEQLEHHQKREKARAIKTLISDDIKAVLNPEQLLKYEAIQKERKEKMERRRKGKFDPEKRAEMKKVDEKFEPQFRAMREKLEPSISSEDKNEIDRLRKYFAEVKAEKEAKFKNAEERKDRPGPRDSRAFKDEHAKAFGQVKSLFEKYESQIAAIFEANESVLTEYKKAKQAVCSGLEHKEGAKGTCKPSERGKKRFAHKFLLM